MKVSTPSWCTWGLDDLAVGERAGGVIIDCGRPGQNMRAREGRPRSARAVPRPTPQPAPAAPSGPAQPRGRSRSASWATLPGFRSPGASFPRRNRPPTADSVVFLASASRRRHDCAESQVATKTAPQPRDPQRVEFVNQEPEVKVRGLWARSIAAGYGSAVSRNSRSAVR